MSTGAGPLSCACISLGFVVEDLLSDSRNPFSLDVINALESYMRDQVLSSLVYKKMLFTATGEILAVTPALLPGKPCSILDLVNLVHHIRIQYR
jgi:hypothetical protein